jgi:hypothetical protein
VPDFFLQVIGSTQKFVIQPSLQDPACNYNSTYSVTFRNLTDLNAEIDFRSLLLKNPKIEGTMPTDLGLISGNEVIVKTADESSVDKYFATFVTGTV